MSKARTYTSKTLERFLAKQDPRREKRVALALMLANKIYEGMKAKGLNQKQFAQQMDQEESVISKWLSGSHNFTVETLWNISDALGIELINVEQHTPSRDILVLVAPLQKSAAITDLSFVNIEPINNSNDLVQLCYA